LGAINRFPFKRQPHYQLAQTLHLRLTNPLILQFSPAYACLIECQMVRWWDNVAVDALVVQYIRLESRSAEDVPGFPSL
jgi:hypothetical protein